MRVAWYKQALTKVTLDIPGFHWFFLLFYTIIKTNNALISLGIQIWQILNSFAKLYSWRKTSSVQMQQSSEWALCKYVFFLLAMGFLDFGEGCAINTSIGVGSAAARKDEFRAINILLRHQYHFSLIWEVLWNLCSNDLQKARQEEEYKGGSRLK